MRCLLVFCFIVISQATCLLSADFPQFRGPGGMAHISDQTIPSTWSESENVAWRMDIPGSGWSQPVITGTTLYLTTAIADRDLTPKDFSDGVKSPSSMGLGGFSRAPDVTIDWQVQAYDAVTGKSLWKTSIATGKPQHAIHPSNTYATETPVADDQGVYAFFGATGTLAALDTVGNLLWKQELGSYPTSNSFGTGSSLAIHNGKVFVQLFTQKSSLLAAYDTKTGEQAWSTERDKKETSWSSPILWKNSLRTELLTSGDSLIISYNPDNGNELWRLGNVKAPTACSIAADSQCIYFGASDPFSKGPLVALKAGASGDISPEKSNETFPNCQWLIKRAGPGMSSPVSSGDYLYVPAENILRCYNAATGELVYQNRLPDMKLVAACPLLINDQILIIDEAGTAALVKTGPEFRLTGGGTLNELVWATPAIAHNSLYIRTAKSLYCIRNQ